jgi:excisionase family DNA binding protein
MSIQSTGLTDDERLVVGPRAACVMLDVGNTRLYELIASGELESYRDGRSRKITLASIYGRVTRLLAASGHQVAQSPRRRGRPRKSSNRTEQSCSP